MATTRHFIFAARDRASRRKIQRRQLAQRLFQPALDGKELGYDVALEGIKSAGYKLTGLLTAAQRSHSLDRMPRPIPVGTEKEIAHPWPGSKYGCATHQAELPLDEQVKDMRRQIDNGKLVGVEFLLTFGAAKAEHFENYCKLMGDAAAYSQERGLKLISSAARWPRPCGFKTSFRPRFLRIGRCVAH